MKKSILTCSAVLVFSAYAGAQERAIRQEVIVGTAEVARGTPDGYLLLRG